MNRRQEESNRARANCRSAVKKLILLPVLLFAGTLAAQEVKTIPSKVTEATVFFSGAELIHTARATLVRGENVLAVEGLSPAIDPGSIKVKTSGGVVVSASEFSIDYLSTARVAGPGVQKLKDSIDFYQAKLDKTNIDLKINSDLTAFLQSGIEKNVSGSENGLSVDELLKTMSQYREKSGELQTRQTALEKQKTELAAALTRLQRQLEQENAESNKTSGVLRLTLAAPAAGNTNFEISYVTPAAGWVPYYDINIASTEAPIAFALKSRVHQSTGLDWERVKLTLSTAMPSNGKVAPLFNTWFLQPVTPVVQVLGGRAPGIAMQNAYSYDVAIEEVVVVGFGQQRKDASSDAVQESRMDRYVTAQQSDLNLTYAIELPCTIPGNGKKQNIDLLVAETPAVYRFYSAPKLDTETYLLAEIAEWQNLGLLSGTANLTYEGTWIGETFIDASSTQQTLSLTLGTEPRVAVKREKLQDFSSTRTLGGNTEQTFTYQITVKNNLSRPVDLVLKDQYPTSTNREIVVTLDRDRTTRWTDNVAETGVITWEGPLTPGETRTYRISYTVRYPKNMRLNL